MMTAKATIPQRTGPHIYVACLASYNAGKLHGVWIDCTFGEDSIWEEIREMLRASPCPNVTVEHDGEQVPSAEEFAIHDHENFEGYEVGEYESIAKVAEVAEGIEKHGEAFAAFLGYDSYNKPEDFEDRYRGSFSSFRDFSDDYADECVLEGNKNEVLARYFDYEAFARDLEHDFLVIDGATQVHVFDNN